MKKSVIIIVLAVIVSMCCITGCKETLQPAPPTLKGDELVIAVALRRHMYNHQERFGFDYKYIFLTVFGKDPDRDFMNYFDDLFSQVLPGSEMREARYGYENLSQASGVWVRFEVIDFESVSDLEAQVSCQAFEHNRESPIIRYRMQMLDGQWKATAVTGVEEQRILQ